MCIGKCYTDKHKISFPEIPDYYREVLKQCRPKINIKTPSEMLKIDDKLIDLRVDDPTANLTETIMY